VEIQILVGGHGKIGYGFAIKNHGKARQNLFLDTDNGSSFKSETASQLIR
jgi:hypothetical protein